MSAGFVSTRAEGAWETVAELVSQLGPDDVVVIDLPGGSGDIVHDLLLPTMQAVEARFVTLWALDPGAKPVASLKAYLAEETDEPVFVGRSVFKVDEPGDFVSFERARKSLNLRGGTVFDVPKSPLRARLLMVEGDVFSEAVARSPGRSLASFARPRRWCVAGCRSGRTRWASRSRPQCVWRRW
jgi:hypothetical protein